MILTSMSDENMNSNEDDYNDSEIENEDDIENSENDDDEEEWEDADNESEGGESDDVDPKEQKIKHNPGWADAMAKILMTNKPKRKKSIVLAKAKKLKPSSQDEHTTEATFEVEGEENEKKPKIKVESAAEIKERIKLETERRIKKKLIESKGRLKPSVLDKDREKVLSKVATKGVVQLFNAVRQQQKNLDDGIKKAGPSDGKQEKVLKSVDKRAFLDVLMGAKSQTVPEVKEESTSEWSVLRNDFMMGTKLKDWDKSDDTSKIE